ncbi:MAG: CbtB-domain containing protein [Rhodospirillales bacterium]|nr:CbtB-domain containing protein [Rhodospirillales bacterium]
MNNKTIAFNQQTQALDSSRIAPAIAALMVGAFLVLGVGFAHSNTVHNAAHDARHAFAFPCH